MKYPPPRFGFRLLRHLLGWVGIDAFPKRPSHHYVLDYFGRSSVNQADIREIPGFGDIARLVLQENRTLLYYDRLYMLYQALVNLRSAKGNEPVCLAEVGVYRGGTSHFLALAANSLGLQLEALFSCDTFEGHDGRDVVPDAERSHRAGLFSDTVYEDVRDLLKPFPNVHVLKGRIQDRCDEFSDRLFHLVHLDVDLYAPTAFALDFFGARLATGGVIIVDDYQVSTCPGTARAIDEFLGQRHDYFKVHPLTKQCILIKQGRPS